MTASLRSAARRSLLLGGVAAAAGACTGGSFTRRVEARWPPTGAFTDAEGLRVHYVEGVPRDAAAPTVVLIHGATGNLRDMTFDMLPRLAADGRRVIAFDRPGQGYTERPAEEGWLPRTQARVLREAAARIGADRDLVLLGHSWGAGVALAWALDDPDAVRGVVTVSGATMPWGERKELWAGSALQQLASEAYGGVIRLTIDPEGDRAREVAARIFEPQEPPEGYLDHVGGPLVLRPDAWAANAKDINRLDAALFEQSMRYPDLSVPVVALHGGVDEITSAELHARGLAAVLPDGRADVLPGIGHMLHHARPERVAAAVRDLST